MAWTGLKCRNPGGEDGKRLAQRHTVDRCLRHEVGGLEAAVEAVDDPVRAIDQNSPSRSSGLPAGQRRGHTPGGSAIQSRRCDNPDPRTVTEPGTRSPQRGIKGLVLAGGQGGSPPARW